MFFAKPFVGFSLFYHAPIVRNTNILVKAFSKRKQEYTIESEFNIEAMQQRLAHPAIGLSLLFAFFLDILFPAFSSSKPVLSPIGASGRPRSFSSVNSYLLTGKLII